MKKSLFAIAAVTAFAGAAQAQSSVTVYGILDVGYTGGSVSNQAANGVGNTAMNVGRISNSMESGSRIGFRGNEDLGGGTSAQFVFELGIQPAGNAGSNPAGNANVNAAGVGSTNWSPDIRQAFVGLTQKGAGTVRIGTQNTLYWEQAGSNTTGQLAQTLGSMLAPTTVGPFFTAQGPAAGNGPNGLSASTAAYTSRTNNTINLRSERMNGFMLKASYNQSNQSSNVAVNAAPLVVNGVNDQTGYQVAGEYVMKKVNLQASYAGFTSQNSDPALAANTWGANLQGTNVRDNQMLVTGSYDFGVLKAFVGYSDRRATSTNVANFNMTRTAYEIGVRSFITSKVEAWASGGMGRYKAPGVLGNTANLTGYQVGSNYWLSKRTNLYGIVGANNVAATTANGANNPATGKQDAFQYSLGVRHTF